MTNVNTTRAALAAPGVVDVLGAADVPRGRTLQFDEPLFFAVGEVLPFDGAAVAFVVAETALAAQQGALAVRLDFEEGEQLVVHDLEAARRQRRLFGPEELQTALLQTERLGGLRKRGLPLQRASFEVSRVEAQAAAGAQNLKGTVRLGGQSHFYMEPQTALAVPSEGGLELWTGDQDPTFTQTSVAQLLGLDANQVNVRVRRVGGGFGGKLTRQAPLAVACSLAAQKFGRPTFASNERLADMRTVGGREPIAADYEVSFDGSGTLEALTLELHFEAGWFLGDASGDLAMAVGFSDNAFYCPSFHCKG